MSKVAAVLPLLDMATKVERLLEADREWGLVVRRAKKQSVDFAVGSARNDVLDSKPGLLPWHGVRSLGVSVQEWLVNCEGQALDGGDGDAKG